MRYIAFIIILPLLHCQSNDEIRGPDLTPISVKNRLTTRNLTVGPSLNPTQSLGTSCVTDSGLIGECVSYYLCDINSFIVDDGADLVDVRDSSNYCSHYLDVCCLHDNVREENTDIEDISSETDRTTKLPQRPPKQPAPESNPDRPAVQSDSLPYPRPSIELFDSSDADATKAPNTECGWSNIKISPYKPNDPSYRPNNITTAYYGEYPFMVAVMRRGTDVWSPNFFVAGGALIHHRVVVTVVHNVQKYQAEQLKCRAGEYDVQTVKEQYPHQERNVHKIIEHENYYKVSVYNDITLLFLESEFTAAPNIGIACLASTFPSADDCYSMGWGREVSRDRSGNLVTILKKVPLPLVSAKECQTMMRENSRLGPYFELHDSLTCAGGQSDIDTCTGDGGSPLVCAVQTRDKEKRFVVVGLVAYGIGCGIKGIPGVYVNIPHLYNWVRDQFDREDVQKLFVL